MRKEDFQFIRNTGGAYCDYWFKITGKTKIELTQKYMEQSMIEVSEAVFSIQDGQWGIKKVFPFNFEVIAPEDDEELYEMIKEIAWDYYSMHDCEILDCNKNINGKCLETTSTCVKSTSD